MKYVIFNVIVYVFVVWTIKLPKTYYTVITLLLVIYISICMVVVHTKIEVFALMNTEVMLNLWHINIYFSFTELNNSYIMRGLCPCILTEWVVN